MRTTTERRTTISLAPPSTPRLRMRPPGPEGGPQVSLDGGWWPRSTDPVAELPGLILALQAHGPADDHRLISHIMLRVSDWDGRPRRLRVDGPDDTRVVRLSWFDTLPAGLLTAIYADGRRVDLLTVPPATGHAAAWAGLELAAYTTNHLSTPELLAALTTLTGPDTGRPDTGRPDTPADTGEAAETDTASRSAWETDGGRLRERPGGVLNPR
ncbi:DUF5994 family protein [Spirillospora sp. NPDC029432]|uniref:DUF5994 family protein n=1 Tax=Spirillospora sp. NPDC029432 TaxID=3154599 RepID=UPI003456E429